MGTSSKELAMKLRKRSRRQQGCFTASQAIEIGYADSVHLYHVRNGEWIRVFRGVYRFSNVPETPASRCMAALLWTRDKNGKIQGFLTPEAAAALRDGTLRAETPIPIAVPKGFRRSSDTPPGIQLIYGANRDHKTSKMGGLPVQAPPVGAPPGVPPHLDAPDYYDWLDYQAVLCATPS